MDDPRTAVATARPTTRAALALALLLSLVAGTLGAPTSAPTPPLGDALARVVVEARADLGAVTEAVARQGGRVVDVLAPFGLVVAEVPPTQVDELQADATTGVVTPDVPLEVQSADVASATRATVAAPADADAGEGVGVVLVDTGVADHPDLDDAVVAHYALTPGRRDTDAHGHGTFLAGLVAGSGASSDGLHTGVAPGAHLVSVRVADADGQTSLTRVLAGLMVADMARDRHDAPVVLLALSGPTGDVPDPVMMVLEMLWARGSTVVVAAGNDGQVGSPGADPYLLTVGALDDAGTPDPSDDVVAPWSARGPSPWGHAKPDLVAPGVSLVGARAPGSTIDVAHPDARVGDHHFRGSGTSMAAAVTAGAAAILLADQPDLTPDAVKGRLMGSTAPAPAGSDPMQAGTGVLDVEAALASTAPPANGDLAPLPTPGPDRRPDRRPDHARGNPSPAGWSWAGWSWAGWTWDGWSWAGGAEHDWAGWSWAEHGWTGWSWSGWTWDGWSWNGWSWNGWSWDGWSWDGWSWDGWAWSSAAWGDTA